jgi:hypothetical protein
MMDKKTKIAAPIHMWAPIRKAKRGADWIIWTDIRSTRREAKRAYLDQIEPAMHKDWLRDVRFAKVSVVEIATDTGEKE